MLACKFRAMGLKRNEPWSSFWSCCCLCGLTPFHRLLLTLLDSLSFTKTQSFIKFPRVSFSLLLNMMCVWLTWTLFLIRFLNAFLSFPCFSTWCVFGKLGPCFSLDFSMHLFPFLASQHDVCLANLDLVSH
jgi:hypothetical protein